ncbi:hypothetical protein ScPMuIL_000335 [Solemya velum]
MAWPLKKKIIVQTSLGTVLAVLGGGLIPLMAWYIRDQVEKNVLIKEGNELYEIWRDVPIPVYMQFYMFDVVNPQEVLDGERPYVTQKGPYTYREYRSKVNITFNDNGTVTYRQPRTFSFEPEMSVGNESDEFTTANPLIWTILQALRWEPPWLQELLSVVSTAGGEQLFFRKSVRDIVWGYEDELIHTLQSIDKDWFYSDIVGYFINKNDTDDGVYTVFTGETDINKVGVINRYNGSSSLNFWTTPWANMVNGTDGTLAPPYMDKSVLVPLFASDICRSVTGEYYKDVSTPQGIDLWRYAAPSSALDNATVNPDNAGFCTPRDSCLPTGLLNVSTCQLLDFFHIPAAISFPHFYLADQAVVDSVGGLHPNAEEHQTAVDVEPYTGLVLQAAKRLQINIRIQPFNAIPSTAKVKDVYLPVFWINESAVVDDVNAEKLKSMLFTPLLIVHVLEYSLIGVGVTILVFTAIVGLWKKKATEHDRNTTDDSTSERRAILHTSPMLIDTVNICEQDSTAIPASSPANAAHLPRVLPEWKTGEKPNYNGNFKVIFGTACGTSATTGEFLLESGQSTSVQQRIPYLSGWGWRIKEVRALDNHYGPPPIMCQRHVPFFFAAAAPRQASERVSAITSCPVYDSLRMRRFAKMADGSHWCSSVGSRCHSSQFTGFLGRILIHSDSLEIRPRRRYWP